MSMNPIITALFESHLDNYNPPPKLRKANDEYARLLDDIRKSDALESLLGYERVEGVVGSLCDAADEYRYYSGFKDAMTLMCEFFRSQKED